MKPSDILVTRRPDGSVTTTWKGLSPFIGISGYLLDDGLLKPKPDGTYEIGQWRFRRLFLQFTEFTYCDSWICMKDGLTARILAAYFEFHYKTFFRLATWESKRRSDFVSGETLPLNSISGLWGAIDVRFRRLLCQ